MSKQTTTSPLLQRDPEITVSPGPDGFTAETRARTGEILRATADTEHRAQARVAAMWASRESMTLELDGHQPVPVQRVELIGPEVTYVRAAGAVMPDPAWSFADREGHEHRWVATNRTDNERPSALPTLQRRRETVPCDGTCGNWDCEGWSRSAWNCRQCGALVEPGYRPDHAARSIGVPIVQVPERVVLHLEAWPLAHDGEYRMSVVAEVPAHRAAQLFGGRTVLAGRGYLRPIEQEWRAEHPPIIRSEVEFVADPAPREGA